MKRLLVVFIFSSLIFSALAQDFNDASQYLDYINKYLYEINKAMWKYLKVSAHSTSEKRQAVKKQNFIKTIEKSRQQIAKMPPFNGDPSLRDSIVAYLDFAKAFVSGDLTRLEELQAKSTKSYEDMVRYLRKEAEISRKYQQRFEAVDNLLEQFAEANNIQLVESEDKLSVKIREANRVYDYSNKIYLIYFKPFIDATYLYKAIADDDTIKLIALTDSLLRDVARGKTLLASIQDFDGDNSLKNAADQAFSDFKTIALDYMPKVYEFYRLKKQVAQADSLLRSKTQDQWTQEEIDRYNRLVNQYNAKVQQINQVFEQIRQTINNSSARFEQVHQQFLHRHVPR